MNIRGKLRTESAVFLVVLAGILILLNLLSVKFFSRFDLTEDGLFSLSRASINVVSGLEDKLVVKAYFTENLPGRFASLERHVHDLLEEYEQHSGGKMEVRFIDPALIDDDEEREEEEEIAKSLGIQKMPNPDIEKDQATIKEGYRGIAFSYGQQTEAIRAIDSPVGLEYLVTTALKKVTGHKANVGFLVGHGEPEIDPPSEENRPLLPEERLKRGAFRNIRANLEIYNFRQIDTRKGAAQIPPEVDALVIVGPNQQFSDKDIYRLDQYLLAGNSIAVFLAGVDIQVQPSEIPVLPPTYNVIPVDPGLGQLLEHHGIRLNRDLVYDKQSSNFVSKCPPLPLALPRPYPPWPLATAFDEDHAVTFRLGSLTLPYVSPVRVTKEALEDEAREAKELAFSSGNSWIVKGDDAVVEPCEQMESKELESGVPLVAAVSGTFTSFFKGKEIPVEDKPKEGEEQIGAGATKLIEKSRAPGRLIVVGSAGLPLDESLIYVARMDRRQAENNFTFVQNVLDWMTNEDELIAVRMKTVSDPPLEKGHEGAKAAAKWANLIGVPLAFLAFGVVRWRVRAGRRKATKKKAG
jgi:gliding-associated putative ABC transporter substrate-binding component GldG